MPWGNGNNSGGNSPWGRPTGGNDNQPPKDEIDEMIRKSKDSLKNVFGGGGNGGNDKGNNKFFGGFKGTILIILAISLLWLSTGIYRVDADEQGVVLRFGKFHRITESGLNYHLPSPIETVFTPRITAINREEIGFRSVGGRQGNSRHVIDEESLMLTSDKNIVSAQFEVQWRIKDAQKFLFNLRNPSSMVKPVAETAMREIMGNTPLSLALSDKRPEIAEETTVLMQQIMDEYNTGIDIYEVNLLAVDAPEQVVNAFMDVLSAQQEKETLRNKAMKYRDGIIPVAEGQVEKMIKDAEGYRQAVVSSANGDAARFISIYNQYKNAKNVTRKRIYLETMEKVMKDVDKVIMSDNTSKGILPYLPLPAIKK